jgi:signal transduction histidine kinase
VGRGASIDGRNVSTQVLQTGGPVRIDGYGPDAGTGSAPLRRGQDPFRRGGADQRRLAGFTELVASAVANAEARLELTASRARIVAAADNTRRRIERDLHDGAQQHLSRWRCNCAPHRGPCRRTRAHSPSGWVS